MEQNIPRQAKPLQQQAVKLRPTAVTADRSRRELLISWNDGHQSRLPFAGLRAVCPCVECRGGHAHMGQPPDVDKVRDTATSHGRIFVIEVMGRSYGLLAAQTAIATGADSLVSGDCGCLMNITGHLEHRNEKLRGSHIASFLWERTHAADS